MPARARPERRFGQWANQTHLSNVIQAPGFAPLSSRFLSVFDDLVGQLAF